MPAPHNIINIPRDRQIQRTVVLLHQNLVNIHAFDAATKQSIKIDNREYITLTPNRSKPTTLRVYHVPSEGPYFASFTIKNLRTQAIFIQTNFQPSGQFLRLDPGKVMSRNLE
ncbi:Hypothetical predicted protein, partial [Paramuricea clavata]